MIIILGVIFAGSLGDSGPRGIQGATGVKGNAGTKGKLNILFISILAATFNRVI